MQIRWFGPLAISFFVTTAFLSSAVPPHFLFPLPDYPDRITGSFGEFRSGHLHGGIDIGTLLRVGLPVIASDSGYVAQVSSSDSGYGKTVLIQHPSGFSTFYAHLDDFSPTIKAHLPENPTFTKNFLPGEIPVQAGEIIAYSGESGAGFPHLHFEIRFGGQSLNPLQFGLGPPDTTPPVPLRLYLIPADPLSSVPSIVALQDESGKPLSSLTLPITGRFWVELDAYDPGIGSSRLVPSRISAHAGDYCFSLNLDSLTPPTHLRVYEVYNPASSHLSPTFFTFRLYDFGSSACSPVWDTATPLLITLSDPAGNEAILRVSSVTEGDSKGSHSSNPTARYEEILKSPAFSGPSAPPLFALPSGLYVAGTLSRNFTLSLRGEVLLHGTDSFPQSGAVVSLASYPFPVEGRLELLPKTSSGAPARRWDFIAGEADPDKDYTFSIAGFRFSLPAGSLRRPVSIAAVIKNVDSLPPRLRALSSSVFLSPFGEPLAFPLKVETDASLPITRKSGIYRLDSFSQTWKVVPFERNQDILSYNAPYFAIFSVLEDESPPDIRDLYIYRDRLAIPIRDVGLGVDPASIAVTFGGKPVRGNWDPDWGHFLTEIPGTQINPRANLRVRVTDRAGNSASRVFLHPIKPASG